MSGGPRPPVSVVMPFAGDLPAAERALAVLTAIDTREGDELILADNSGTASVGLRGSWSASEAQILSATGERSPAHARNAGAGAAEGVWILFLDADVSAPAGLIDAFFDPPPNPTTGAVAGEITAAPNADGVAERYAAARNPLSQRAHLSHPYKPRAAAANLLVLRAAYQEIGGFTEGLRAAEDTDLCWRLQEAGWALELRSGAAVTHRYRTSVGELRRQWRGYAAGRAWLSRRYAGFTPQTAAARALRRILRAGSSGDVGSSAPRAAPGRGRPRRERAAFLALDALLAGEELVGLALSNRPPAVARKGLAPGDVVLVADRFPGPGRHPTRPDAARIEAQARPDRQVADRASIPVLYAEDEGAVGRLWALAVLVLLRPGRVVADRRARLTGDVPLAALAPAVRRLRRDPPAAGVQALAGTLAERTAERLRALSGRSAVREL